MNWQDITLLGENSNCTRFIVTIETLIEKLKDDGVDVKLRRLKGRTDEWALDFVPSESGETEDTGQTEGKCINCQFYSKYDRSQGWCNYRPPLTSPGSAREASHEPKAFIMEPEQEWCSEFVFRGVLHVERTQRLRRSRHFF